MTFTVRITNPPHIAGRPKTAICCVNEKNPDRLCMINTLRGLDFFVSLHLTIFGRPANFEFIEQSG